LKEEEFFSDKFHREKCGVLLFLIYILSVLLSVLFLCQFAIRIVPKGRIQNSIPASAPEHSSKKYQEVEKTASSPGEAGFFVVLENGPHDAG